MSHQIFILPPAEKDGQKLSREAYQRCRQALLKLAFNPRPSGCKKLVGEEGYRIRAGDYRILYRIDDTAKKIFIYRIKHRREVYR